MVGFGGARHGLPAFIDQKTITYSMV